MNGLPPGDSGTKNDYSRRQHLLLGDTHLHEVIVTELATPAQASIAAATNLTRWEAP